MFSSTFISWSLLVIAACCDCFTLYVIRLRALSIGSFKATNIKDTIVYCKLFLSDPLVVLAVITFMIGLPLGYIVVTRLPVTIFYPVNVALHIFLALLMGVLLLGETLSMQKIIAIGLLFVAVILVATSKS